MFNTYEKKLHGARKWEGADQRKQVRTWHDGVDWKDQNELKNELNETNAKKLLYLLYRVKKIH